MQQSTKIEDGEKQLHRNLENLDQRELAAAETNDQPDPKLKPRYLDKRGVAAMFGVHIRTVDSWMRRRLIGFLKIGRSVFFDPADIERHLHDHCRVGPRGSL